MVIYITYFIGLTGGASVDVLREEGSTTAIRNLFGNIGGTILNAFIVISCLGTLNGLMLACTRSLYSLSVRDCGPAPKTFAELDPHTNMPSNSGVFALLCCGAWFFYFYAANLTAPVFGLFSFDSSELPIITIYAIYIPIFVMFIKKEGKNNVFKNIMMPILALIASVFMVFVAVYAHGVRPYPAAAENGEFVFPVLFYLIVFAVIMVIGAFLYQKKNKK
jgi:APA family basic amino acid/polyamine antiporter